MNCVSCKTKKTFFILIAALLLIVILSLVHLLIINSFNSNKEILNQNINLTNDVLKDNEVLVIINNESFKLEIVSSPLDMYNGLSNRKGLCPNCGMLFVFPNLGQQSFVMRNMNFPLDIIFIADGKIVKIYENLAPEGSAPQNFYNSDLPANQVLEINAGLASQLGLKVGDDLILP